LLVLASASPRRVELLNKLDLEFIVVPSDVEEDFDSRLSPSQVVVELAKRKAEAVANSLKTEAKAKASFENGGPVVVIGADTIVVSQGHILGKPASEMEAMEMLSLLSGQVHEVYTGIALVGFESGRTKESLTSFVISKVRFRQISAAEIKAYVATGEPMDKAGGYALQGTGAALIESVDGCYTNIIGLPIPALVSMLRQLGVKVLGQ
jgi:septum formation protein